jgi:hypothetical protein
VREVYLYAWDTASEEEYGEIYLDLNCRKRKKIRQKSLPYHVFELVEENDKKDNIRKGLMIPKFGGDAYDN